MFKELRPESLLEDDDPDDEHSAVVLGDPMAKSGTTPPDERPGTRRVSSFGPPKSAGRSGIAGESERGSLYDRLMEAGALDEVMSIASEESFDPRVPLTPLPEAPTPSKPLLTAPSADLAEELEPARDSAEALRDSDLDFLRDSAELLRESDLDILDDGAFIVRPESSPISYRTDPRIAPPRLPRRVAPARAASVVVEPGASIRSDPAPRQAVIPSTHPLANTLMPVANTLPPRPPTRRSPWWQMTLAAVALLGLGVALGRMQQRPSRVSAPTPLAQRADAHGTEQVSPSAAATQPPMRVTTAQATDRQTARPKASVSAETPVARKAPIAPIAEANPAARAPKQNGVALGDAPAAELVDPKPSATDDEPAERDELAPAASAALPVSVAAADQAVDSNLPARPSRDAVVAALTAVAPELATCVGPKHGVANVTLTVRGTGAVSHALVTGIFAGTPEGSCIARAVKLARFQPFRDATVRIAYPFQL